MRILVFGGTGAMGSPLTDILLSAGHEVIVTTRKKRISNNSRLKYVVGDAHNQLFLQEIVNEHADVIIDFMHYSTEEFSKRYRILLEACDHYFFFSSSRVYADNDGVTPITESCPRLLDTNVDEVLIRSDEYPISKARCENLLKESSFDNWTIIRPYITFGHNRLQLGIFEIEAWLHKAINQQPIVIPIEILNAKTTLTYGGDVAESVALLVGQDEAKGKTIHITSNTSLTWREVADIYNEVFVHELGYGIIIHSDCNIDLYSKAFYSSRWQIKYDRCYDRHFDNGLIQNLTGKKVDSDSLHNHIEKTLCEILKKPTEIVSNISPVAQACMDRITGDKTDIASIHGIVPRVRYLIGRYTPIPISLYLNVNNWMSDKKHGRKAKNEKN